MGILKKLFGNKKCDINLTQCRQEKNLVENFKNENIARIKMGEQFGITKDTKNDDLYDVIWSVDRNVPFILILNKFNEGKLVAKEWYEFQGTEWKLIVRLSRIECIDLYWYYRRKQSLEWYGRDIRDDNNWEQTERISRAFLDEYFVHYKQLG